MTKKKSKSKEENIIKKTEHSSFLKKFTADELIEKEKQFAILCVEKSKSESKIEKLKSEIKTGSAKIKQLASDLDSTGVTVWDECDVEINVSEMKKRYYFEGELVDEEDADESDLQLEITE